MRQKTQSKYFQISKSEKSITRALASVFALRMIGLFMILPIFSLYANNFKHTTPALIGMALGAYGITSGLLQAPLGALSDKIGRKKVIIFGLIIFAIGSIICAYSQSIYGIITGRALQGAGAIGSTILACTADATREEIRTKAMAIMGISIGVSFMVAMILGPILSIKLGISGIFDITAMCALLAIAVVWVKIPSNTNQIFHRDQQIDKKQLIKTLKNTQLIRLDLGIFFLHAILTATFIVLPITLTHQLNLTKAHQAWIYAPVLLLSFFIMIPFIIIAETKYKMKQVFVGAIALFGASQILFIYAGSHTSIIIFSLLVFFTAFILLESTLPSMVSKISPISAKGTALGVYSSCQFFGAFLGGSVGGYLYGLHNIKGVYIFCLILSFIWIILAASMQKPEQVATRMINIKEYLINKNDEQINKIEKDIMQVPGVKQVKIILEDGIAYLKVDSKKLKEDNLIKYSKA